MPAGYMWTGELDSNTLRVDAKNIRIRVDGALADSYSVKMPVKSVYQLVVKSAKTKNLNAKEFFT